MYGKPYRGFESLSLRHLKRFAAVSGFLFFCRTAGGGSCAIGVCEPCQVRKEAALSGSSYVPQECLRLWPYRETTKIEPAVYDSRFFCIIDAKVSLNFFAKLDISEAIAQRREAPHGQ